MEKRKTSQVRRVRRVPSSRPPRPGAAASSRRRPRPVRQNNIDDGRPNVLLKILTWLGIILLCFVIGYMGTSWLMDLFNKKLLLKPENRIENQEDLSNLEESERNRAATAMAGDNVRQVSLNLFHVMNDSIAESRRSFIARTTEDNIKDAIDAILLLSEVPDAGKIKLLHVFRNAETAFLDMSGQFVSSLNAIGQRQSLLLLTGIVRTMQENFSPVSQVRFLIDSKQPQSGGVVDLSVPWKMPGRS